MKNGIILIALSLLGTGVESWQQSAMRRAAVEHAKKVSVGAALAIAIATGRPPDAAAALSPPLSAAIVETSDAAYPVLQSLSSSDALSPFANKIAALLTTKVNAEKAAVALDRGLDAFLGIADEDVSAFAAVVRESYGEASPDACAASVRIPSDALSKLASSSAAASVDGEKLRAAGERASGALASFPRSSDGAICLPPTKEGLERIWAGQTELSLAVPRRAAREFVAAASAAGKSVPPSEVLRILPEAKQLTKGLDAKTVKKFEMTGKNLDSVLKNDPGFARLLPK